MESGHNNHKKGYLYMPRMCSSTSIIKDVHLPKLNRHSSSSSSSSSSFNDPSSPRVTCMGKVKRGNAFSNVNHHYKFMAAPATTRSSTCRKLEGNFLRKHIKGSNSVTSRKDIDDRSARGYKCRLTMPMVNISQMDPPLPVVKRVKDPGFYREEVNLWKRRNEFASQSLELSHIHVPKNYFSLIESDRDPS